SVWSQGLLLVRTEIANETGAALRLAGDADVAAMQDQPVMRVALELRRHVVLDGALDGQHVAARRDAGAVGHPEDMGIDRLRREMEPHVQHDIRRLAPD